MDLMIDLETFGLGPTPAIVQIGAVIFNPFGGVSKSKNMRINISLQSAVLSGGNVDPSTIDWWRRQSPEAKKSICEECVDIHTALLVFKAFWEAETPDYVWSHGAASDVPWLEAAYKNAGISVPWRHTEVQDTRTVFRLAARKGWARREFPASAVKHDALDDAEAQAHEVISAIDFLGLK